MAKTIQTLIPTVRMSKPHATKKRASGKLADKGLKPKHNVPSAGTTKTARQVETDTHMSVVSRGSGGQSSSDTQHEAVPTPSKPKRNRKTNFSLKSKNEMSSVESADDQASDTQESILGALPFPNELLQDYRIYRQLQSAIGRLTNQIKAIQKYDPLHGALLPLADMRETGKRSYKAAEKKITASVRTLPVWEHVKGVRGLAENSLGQIIGETGDLSNYANPAKLWQRMGLGMVNGHRQQNWSQDRKGFTKSENIEMAILMGYSARRRALMHVVGSNLIRAKNPEYGKLYRERKVFELTKLPERDPVTGKKIKGRLSHAHKRAMRYMEKRFLLNLWKAWRGQIGIESQAPDVAMPSTKINQLHTTNTESACRK